MKLLDWLWNRRVRAKTDLRQRGYDYAAGRLLRGDPIEEVEIFSFCVFDQNEFNYGVQSACLAWDRMNYERRTRP